MATDNKGILFEELIFGPLKSRRLGSSLGINLLPRNGKICNFDCIYCECGLTDLRSLHNVKFPERSAVREALQDKLIELSENRTKLDSITFAGNGEPTLHREFKKIMEDVVELRNTYYPECRISVLSNSSMLHSEEIVEGLQLADKAIMKLDAGTEEMYQLINRPLKRSSLKQIVEHLKRFKGELTIQTLFTRGLFSGSYVDNTTEYAVNKWIQLLCEIKPAKVMVYAIDRPAPANALERITHSELEKIAIQVLCHGIPFQVNV
jgi:wyosine [tRNA(Phe)-imidazoG37] synthetase (radical SAM superfamily)